MCFDTVLYLPKSRTADLSAERRLGYCIDHFRVSLSRERNPGLDTSSLCRYYRRSDLVFAGLFSLRIDRSRSRRSPSEDSFMVGSKMRRQRAHEKMMLSQFTSTSVAIYTQRQLLGCATHRHGMGHCHRMSREAVRNMWGWGTMSTESCSQKQPKTLYSKAVTLAAQHYRRDNRETRTTADTDKPNRPQRR